MRAELHTGECEIRGDDIGGIGVDIGARVSALAGPDEVLVSSTLRDLVIGSGLEFEDHGAHALKGLLHTQMSSAASVSGKSQTTQPELHVRRAHKIEHVRERHDLADTPPPR